jgi:dihydrofolate synthase/folylpolyglutamate synthase
LRDLLPRDAELFLDGAHNPSAAGEVARFLAEAAQGRPLHLICGMLAVKDAAGVLAPFKGSRATLHAVPVPDHDHHAPADLVAIARDYGLQGDAANGVSAALRAIARQGPAPFVLIMGSLYLAGEVLRANDQFPD